MLREVRWKAPHKAEPQAEARAERQIAPIDLRELVSAVKAIPQSKAEFNESPAVQWTHDVIRDDRGLIVQIISTPQV
jgi:hypothetical protein